MTIFERYTGKYRQRKDLEEGAERSKGAGKIVDFAAQERITSSA